MYANFVHRVLRLTTGAWFRIQRNFTPLGLFLIVTMCIAAVLGLDTDLMLAYQGFALCAALLLTSWIISRFIGRSFRSRFSLRRHLPPFVTAGEPFSYDVQVTSNRPCADLTLLERPSDPRPSREAFTANAPPWWRGLYPHWRRLIGQRLCATIDVSSSFGVTAGRPTRVSMTGQAQRRGQLRLDAVSVAGADPLAIARGLIDVRQPAALLVLPRRYDLPDVQLPGRRMYQHGGVTLAASKGDSEEFVGLRDYRPGDPLKRIHWKSFARTGKPVVKEYQDEFFERHALVLDTFAGIEGEDRFEEAVSLAASFVCTVESGENLLDLLFVGDQAYTFTAGLGQYHADTLLQVLASVQLQPEKPFDELTRAVLERRATLSGCILILLDWDDSRRQLVRQLDATALPLRVFVLSASEQPPKATRSDLTFLTVGQIEQGLA